MVQDDKNQAKALKYNELVPMIIKAVQEVKEENKTLTTENGQLREKLEALTDRQVALEDMLLVLSTDLPKEKLVKLRISQ